MFILKIDNNEINGNKLDDCRPISITSAIFKLIEILILNKIKLLERNGIIKQINQNQTGFREGSSCSINILKFF